MRALLIEDDAVSVRLIELALKSENIVVESTASGEEGIQLASLYDFDVIILDIRLPDIDGYDVVRRLRQARIRTPVIIVSAKTDPLDKAKGLTSGADDFLSKPFDKSEMMARIQAVIRRSKGHSQSAIKIGRMVVNMDARTIDIDGKRLTVTGKEYSIIELLALRQGTILTKEMFLDHIYGGIDEPELKIIDVFICKLRKKIATLTGGDSYIHTVWGRGYVLKDKVEATARSSVAHVA